MCVQTDSRYNRRRFGLICPQNPRPFSAQTTFTGRVTIEDFLRHPFRLNEKVLSLLLSLFALSWTTLSAMAQTAVSPKDGANPCAIDTKGVVVESITKNSVGERSNLAEGDIIQAWARADSEGKIHSPFDLSKAEIEQGSRGAVTLTGLRGSVPRTWVLKSDTWGIRTRPQFQADSLVRYLNSQRLATGDKLTEAAALWRAGAMDANWSGCSWLSTWFLLHAAEVLSEKRQWKEADGFYDDVSRSMTSSESILSAEALQAWGDSFSQRGDLTGAAKRYQQAVLEDEKQAAETLAAAKHLNDLGRMQRNLSDLDAAEKSCRKGLAIAQTFGPHNLRVGQSLNNLGLIALDRGDLDGAWEFISQALAIRETLSPTSIDTAESLHNIGLVALNKGDLASAEEYTQRALAARENLIPGSSPVAASLNNLGLVFLNRSDLVKADEYFRQALAIKETLTPGSINLVTTLNNLGIIAKYRGDLDAAESYHRRALSIAENAVPNGMQVSSSFSDLADVLEDRGDLAHAEKYYREALTIRQRLVPNSLDVAQSLKNLALNAKDRGEIAEAEKLQLKALSIFEKFAPHGFYAAESYLTLGDLARQRGDLNTAERYCREAVERWRKLAPENIYTAESLASLAEVMRDKQQLDNAAQLFNDALALLDKQITRLGGTSDVRAGFRARHANYYADYIDVLVRQNQLELAFQILERSRARSLLEMLAESNIAIREGVEPSLLERERLLEATFRAKSNRRLDLRENSASQSQLAKLDKEINDLLIQLNEVEGQIRVNSPRYVALAQPRVLNAKEVQQQLLDADTTLLEYALGRDRSYLFALTSTSFTAHVLPKRSEIEELARRAYDSLTSDNRWSPGESAQKREERQAKERSDFQKISATLGRIALGPVAEQLGQKRLVIVSDGALQYLPFGVLPVPERQAGGDVRSSGVPVIAEHEVVNLPSASVLAVLREGEHKLTSEPRKVVAVLADPVFDKHDVRVTSAMKYYRGTRSDKDSEKGSSPHKRLTRSLADVGFRNTEATSLPRLVFSRREAGAIASAAPAGQTLEALDFQATREEAMSQDLAQYRIVHFATHGLLDNKHPELSGLVFSLVTPQGLPRDGFLDLEDIYNLKLHADLVVLSSCETALGKDVAGEGLLGLTRGFMYAGSTRVLSTLWKVDDAATADLMAQFYNAMLQQGLRPAAALRQAQNEMAKRRRWSSSFYWGAFVLQGDWN
jgi:CHAT domain-containing protein/Tfp pilus assembly protein PilF